MVSGSLTIGRLIDRDFRMTKKRIDARRATDGEKPRASSADNQKNEGGREDMVKAQRPLPKDKSKMGLDDLATFPLEHARLRSLPHCEHPSFPFSFGRGVCLYDGRC